MAKKKSSAEISVPKAEPKGFKVYDSNGKLARTVSDLETAQAIAKVLEGRVG